MSETTPRIDIPELSLVALAGVSGSGKSAFARRHFAPTEVLSSDFCRGLVADDENDQAATRDAFDVLYYIAGKRLAAGRLTVVDATNVQADARKPLVEVARAHDVLPVAIVLDLPEKVCAQRNAQRAERQFGERVLRRQHDQLRRSLRSLKREGFRHVWVLKTTEEIDSAVVTRVRMFNDLRDATGPFDMIGDVHGCLAELGELLARLGYSGEHDAAGRLTGASHPHGRTAVFLGDLVDRGPDTPGVLSMVMRMTAAGHALAVLTDVTGGGATIAYFFATQHGFLAITAVLTSLYPAVTIGLARVLASERLSAARLAGLFLAGASVTLIALGGSA